LSDLAFYLGQKEETIKESISLNERILEDCKDDHIRYGVMQTLAYKYNRIGEKEKAINIANKLPSNPVICDMLLDTIYEGEERITHLKDKIKRFCDYLTSDIGSYAKVKYVDDIQKQIELYKKAIDIYKITYENGDYGFYNTRMKDLYLDTASAYMRLKEYDSAIDSLEKAADYTIAFDTMPEVFTYTSMIFDGNEFSKAKNLAKDYDCNDSYLLLHQFLSQQIYDPIREGERFKAITVKLEKYAAKEI